MSKFCPTCGTEAVGAFCSKCGRKLEEVKEGFPLNEEASNVQPENQTVSEPVNETVNYPENEWMNAETDQTVSVTGGAPVPPQQAPNTVNKNKIVKLVLAIGIPVVCLFLVASLIIGAIAIPLFTSPYVKFANALNKNINKESFDLQIEIWEGDENKSESQTIDGAIWVDSHQEQAVLKVAYENAIVMMGNEWTARQVKNGSKTKYYYDDDDTVIKYMFDALEESKKSFRNISFDNFYETLEEEGLYDEFEETFDQKKFEKAVKKILKKCLPDFEKESVKGGKKYSAKVDIYEFLKEACDILASSVKKESVLDEMYDELEEIQDSEVSIDLHFVISGGYLSELGFFATNVDGDRIGMIVTMSEFGKSLTEAEIEEFKNKCNFNS